MSKKPLEIVVELDLISITGRMRQCDPSKWVALHVGLLGNDLRTRSLVPQFPLNVDQTLRFEKVYPLYIIISITVFIIFLNRPFHYVSHRHIYILLWQGKSLLSSWSNNVDPRRWSWHHSTGMSTIFFSEVRI